MKYTSHRLVLVSLISFLLLNGCATSTVTYYRKVDDTGMHGYKIPGSYPISDVIAKKVNCFRFTQNPDGKLSEIAYLRNGKLSPNDEWFYGAARVKFEYTDSIERRLYLNSKGNVFWREDLEADKHNKTVSLSSFDNGETRRDTLYLWKLNEDGRIEWHVYLNGKGERVTNSAGVSEARYEYDKKGNLTTIRFYDSEGKPGEDGHESGIAIIRVEYDDHGNEVKKSFYGVEDNLTEHRAWGCATVISKYDETGNRIEASYYGTDGRLKEYSQFEYDNRGNYVEGRGYGSDGQLKEDSGGWSIMRTVYDQRGNLIEARFYDRHDHLTENRYLGAAFYRRQYDQDDNLIETRYYGINGESKEDSKGIAVIHHEYDDKGNRVKTIAIDKNGKIVSEK
jgi:YD repeat-containing protein